MAVTRLKRKALRNKLNAQRRKARLKYLMKVPVIKKKEVEETKEEN